MKNESKGFTLIELLIVVAIIAILAAIAVPNFLEAQVRAKVSRVKADMRSLATGMESYMVDNNLYPYCNGWMIPGSRREVLPSDIFTYLEGLSTPVAYMTSAFLGDPFLTENRISFANCSPSSIAGGTPTTVNGLYEAVGLQFKSFMYQSWNGGGRTALTSSGEGISQGGSAMRGKWGDNPNAYVFQSGGPDRLVMNSGGILANCEIEDTPSFGSAYSIVYDPTNGTISFGSIWRVAGVANGAEAGPGQLSTNNGRAYGDGFTNVMYRAGAR